MLIFDFIWNDENIEHLAEHGVTTTEARYVVENPVGMEKNRNGDPIAFGYTQHGRHLAVPFVFLDDARTLVYVTTAYETSPRQKG